MLKTRVNIIKLPAGNPFKNNIYLSIGMVVSQSRKGSCKDIAGCDWLQLCSGMQYSELVLKSCNCFIWHSIKRAPELLS